MSTESVPALSLTPADVADLADALRPYHAIYGSFFPRSESRTLLGAIGSFAPLELRVAIATVTALGAVVSGSIEVLGYRVRPIQCDRETPQQWVHTGSWLWALSNGFSLGCGAWSRIGFWLWYAVPFGSFLFGRPELGALLYGAYSFTRGAAVWPIILILHYQKHLDSTAWLLQRANSARFTTAAYILFLGVTLVIAVGV